MFRTWAILGFVSVAASAQAAEVNPAEAIHEFSTYCGRGTALWGRTLCGPIIVVDPLTKKAIASDNPNDPGFTEQDHVWAGTLPKDSAVANTSIELGGRRFAEIMLPLPADDVERRILLSHESYHRIQPDLGFRGHEADNGHLDAKEGRIYARLEIAALKTALSARNWQPAARDAIAYRAARLALYPNAEAAEASLIANEGVAEYTGIKVGAEGQEVQYALQRLASVDARPSLIRSFGYVVGPAYGLLLDRVGNDWRSAALKGRPLPELLSERIGGAASAASLVKYGGPAIIAEETVRDAKIQQRKAALSAELITGPAVIFPFEEMHIDFNPNTLFSMGDAGTVYGQSTTIRDKWGSFHATGDVLLSPTWSYARLPGPATVNGRAISGPGWTAELAPGYVLRPGDRAGQQVVKKQ